MRDVLCALGDSTEPGVRKDLTFIRELGHDEDVKIDAAHRLLRRMTEYNPLAELQEAMQRLGSSIADLHEQSRRSQSIEPAARRVQAEFKIWLSSFRSFDDRLSHWVSSEFGNDSVAVRTFKSALSSEYDFNFAYRLACALRNASEHAGNVLNHISAGAREETGNEIRSHSIVALNGPQLAEQFPKLKPAVREELRESHSPLHVAPLVRWTEVSCMRAYGKLFDSMWNDLETATSLCESLHREALQIGGEWAILVDGQFFKGGMSELTFRHNPWNLAELTRLNRQKVSAMLAKKQPTITADDLVIP